MQSALLGDPVARSTGRPAEGTVREGRAGFLRPRLGAGGLTLLVSLALAVFYNVPFWAEMLRIRNGLTLHDLLFLASVLVLLTGAFNVLLSLVAFRFVQKPALILVLTLAGLATYFIHSYGVLIDSVMIQNVIETDTREVADLLTPRLFLWILLLGALPSWVVCRSRIAYRSWGVELGHRLVGALLSFAALAVAVVPFYADYASIFPQQRQLRHMITPWNFIYGTVRYVSDSLASADLAPPTPLGTDARLVPVPGARKTVVILVIGETARAQQFSLNGYPRETNPVLRGERIFNFDNVRACGTSTAVALPCMFSHRGRDDYEARTARHSEGLLDVLDHAGVSVLWRENNTGCKGACDRIETQESAELWVDELCESGECLDEVLLNRLDEYVDSAGSTAVVVLHQQGSHGPAYYRRYPRAFERFTPTCTRNQLQDCERQEIVNAYDNTILYTDYFLGRVIEFLEARDDRYDGAMLYASDHGESLGEQNVYLHGLPYFMAPAEQTRVPLIAWMSDGFRESNGVDTACLAARHSEALSHDNLFHSVLGLARVRSAVYEKSLDLFSGCRAVEQPGLTDETPARSSTTATRSERG